MRKLTESLINEIADDLDSGLLVHIDSQTLKTFPIPDFEHNIYAERENWQITIDEIENHEGELETYKPMDSYQAFKVMESFVDLVEDKRIQNRLIYALNKSKPFKNFKYEIDYNDSVRDDWFAHKKNQYINWVNEQWDSFHRSSHYDTIDDEDIVENSDFSNTTIVDPNSQRQLISSGAKWEDIVGYSRAIRVGNVIEVAGTTAVDAEGNLQGENDIYIQTKFIFQKIEKALQEAGASLENVVRTRMFVTDISQWENVGKAHGEFFKNIKPASTLLEISGLIDPRMLIEIEVTAVL